MAAIAESDLPPILVEGLRTRIGRQVIHEGLDLQVHRGEILGVVGASGAGKSVLLRTLIGLNRPVAGRIRILGVDVLRAPARERRRLQERWGVLFQHGALFSSLTVAENVRVPLVEHTRLPPDVMDECVALKLALVGLEPAAAAKLPAELSGGMRKRAALARALALDPELLFLDEPTSGLDPVGAEGFDRLVLGLRRSLGLTVFLVTHDLDTLATVCDRIVVLVDGRGRSGTFETLRSDPNPWIREYFGGPRARRYASEEAI